MCRLGVSLAVAELRPNWACAPLNGIISAYDLESLTLVLGCTLVNQLFLLRAAITNDFLHQLVVATVAYGLNGFHVLGVDKPAMVQGNPQQVKDDTLRGVLKILDPEIFVTAILSALTHAN